MDDPGAVSLWLRCTSFSAMQSSPLFVISFIFMGSIIGIAMDIVAYGEGTVCEASAPRKSGFSFVSK